jgi:hypothetical protein
MSKLSSHMVRVLVHVLGRNMGVHSANLSYLGGVQSSLVTPTWTRNLGADKITCIAYTSERVCGQSQATSFPLPSQHRVLIDRPLSVVKKTHTLHQ